MNLISLFNLVRFYAVLALLAFVTVFSGCGGHAKNNPSPVSPSRNTASVYSQGEAPEITFRIVPQSARNPLLPDETRDLTQILVMDEQIYEGDQYQLLNSIPTSLPGGQGGAQKQLFLVWPDSLQGSSIRSVTYSHQAFDENQKPIPTSTRSAPAAAWHDVQNQRWYIPFSSVFGVLPYGWDEIENSHTQTLHLDMIPASGGNRSFTLTFRVLPPIPSLGLRVAGPSPAPNCVIATAIFATEDTIAFTSHLDNPTNRSLRLWVQTQPGASPLKMRYAIGLKPDRPVSSPSMADLVSQEVSSHQYFSETPAEIRKLRITRRTAVQEFPIGAGGWNTVDLGPKETITMAWMFGPTPSAPRCKLPNPISKVASESIIVQKEVKFNPAQNGPFVPPVSHKPEIRREIKTPFQLDWSIVGAEIVGSWSKTVLVADVFTPQEYATGFLPDGTPSARVKSTELHSSEVFSGVENPWIFQGPVTYNKPFACQGVF
ncbi:MAG: hypothetical protein HYX41_00565 [Bdellovibrio sp.]|nr:hypothetical protein [Bdellovibrio sp.]